MGQKSQDMVMPAIRTITCDVVADSHQSVAVISGLTSIMDTYGGELSRQEEDAIAHWFFKNYSIAKEEEQP